MFLNPGKLKKRINEAYKYSGLIVGQVYDGIVLTDGHWGVWFQGNQIPNKVKGALVELIGDLPHEGELLRFKKGNDAAQQEMQLSEAYDFLTKWKNATEAGIVCPVTVNCNGTPYGFIQLHNGDMIPIRQEYLDMIDEKEAGCSNDMPTDPSTNGATDMILWKGSNSVYMAFRACPTDKIFEQVLCNIENIDFSV